MRCVALLISAFFFLSYAVAGPQSIKGTWLGRLRVGGVPLRMVLNVTVDPTGNETATLDSPDQGVVGFPVPQFEHSGDHVVFSAFGGTFDGRLDTKSKSIDGTWKQGGLNLPLKMDKQPKALDYSRPQEPKPPFPYKSEDVTYDNSEQGNRLAGTLTIPSGAGPFPAAILITGSGLQDRNESLLGHKPFLVIADYLTRRGIAVLRVDDRGVGGSTGNPLTSTTADFATDVAAGISYLKSRSEVDKAKIGLIGHSEGGIIAPMVASKSSDVAYIVLLAGTGIRGDALLPMQLTAVLRASGASETAIARAAKDQGEIFKTILSEPDPEAARNKLREVLKKDFERMSPEERKQSGDIETALKLQSSQVLNPWFKYFLTLDPKDYLAKVQCPVLAINGTKDVQVPYKENLEAIEQTLKQAGNKHVTTKALKGLNHLFQNAKTGGPDEYGEIKTTFAPEALKLVGDWVLATVGVKR